MNVKVLAIVGLVAIVVLGFFVFTNRPQETMQQNQVNIATPTAADGESGQYVEYSNAQFEKVSGNKRVLFFYANWCPTCIPADQNFKENVNQIPKDLVLIRVNYDDSDTDQGEKDLANKYGVTYQHTFVQIDKDGNEVAKWNGGQIDELIANSK